MEISKRLEKAYSDYNNLLRELEKTKETSPNIIKFFPIPNAPANSFEHSIIKELGYLDSYIFGLETLARLEKGGDTH